MELNLVKIKAEMKRLDIETKADLARLMGISKQLVQYYFRTKTIKAANAFGRFLKISPKDLIK